MKTRLIYLVLLIVCFSCGTNNKPVSDAQKEEAKIAMITLMNSYVDAIKERNADKIISHYLDSPEFMFYADGKRQGYNELVARVRKDFPDNVSKYDGKWDTINVSVLNPDAVTAAAQFHEVLTNKEGIETRLKGEITWIAVRVEKDWKFIYAHAFYLPDTIK